MQKLRIHQLTAQLREQDADLAQLVSSIWKDSNYRFTKHYRENGINSLRKKSKTERRRIKI
jgi:hypothetical protein